MTSRDGYSISWTSYNQPSVINGAGQSVAFDYDENHQRWRAVYTGPAGTETTYLIGGLLEQVVDVGDTDFRHYVYAGAEKVAIVSRTTSGVNTVRYLRTDHLGGVDGIENPDETSYVKESFAAFGDRRSSCTWTGSPTTGQLSRMAAATRRGFTFHTALGTMGLNDMNGRVEDAVIGRCLSADPRVPDFTNTQDFNRYSYVRNDPLTYIDPSGFDCADTSTGPCQTVTITGTKGSSQQGAPPPGFLPGGFVSPNGSGQPIPANVFGQGELQTVVVTDTRVTHPKSTPVAVSFVPIGTGGLGSFGAPQFAFVAQQTKSPAKPCPSSQVNNDLDSFWAANGLADSTIAGARLLTDGLKNVPNYVNLNSLRVLGSVTTILSVGSSASNLYSNFRSRNWVGVGVNTVDVIAPFIPLVFPPSAPLVIAYGAGRAVGDAGVAIARADSSTCGP